MTSAINTGAINPNFPTPGINNDSQGFRTNFTSILDNLNTAGSEISDLQNNAVLKAALSGQTLNNDMANTLISNAQVLGFRSSTTDLINATGPTVFDGTMGDVQNVTLIDDISVSFTGFAPSGTQSAIEVVYSRSDANTNFTITLPTQITSGATLLENYSGNGTGGNFTFPNGILDVHHIYRTQDCGQNIEVQPLNRPQNGIGGQEYPAASSTSFGYPGQMATDGNYLYVCTALANSVAQWKRVALTVF